MENQKQFFLNLRKNLDIARTQRALKTLEKQAKRFVKELPSTTDERIIKIAKIDLRKFLRLVKKKAKQLG